jgi:hypothetical protein
MALCGALFPLLIAGSGCNKRARIAQETSDRITSDMPCWVLSGSNSYFLPAHKAQEARDFAREVLRAEGQPTKMGKAEAKLQFSFREKSRKNRFLKVSYFKLRPSELIEVSIDNKSLFCFSPDPKLSRRLDAFFSNV